MNCHVDGGRGRLTEGADDDAVSLVMHRYSTAGRGPAAAAGRAPRQQCSGPDLRAATADLRGAGHAAESGLDGALRRSRCHWRTAVVLTCGSRRTVSMISAMGRAAPAGRLSPRLAPQLIGLGLLSRRSTKRHHRREDPDDGDGDGISGRANRVWSRAAGGLRWAASATRPACRASTNNRRRRSRSTWACRCHCIRMPQATARNARRTADQRRTAAACNSMAWRRIVSLPIW